MLRTQKVPGSVLCCQGLPIYAPGRLWRQACAFRLFFLGASGNIPSLTFQLL